MNMIPIDREKIEAEKRNEENTKKQFISPALKRAWNEDDIVMEYFTDGRIVPHDDGTYERKEGKRVDYLLFYQENIPLAVVEAKAYDKTAEDGYSQALEYAQLLDVPFAYASNGRYFIEEDMITKQNRTISMDEFPSASQLWERYKEETNISPEAERLYLTEYQYNSTTGRKPRYYQRIAINRAIKAISEGKKRLLIVMATGTGKTYVGMQIMYRLWKTKQAKKILFLVDRNFLVDQPMKKEFNVFKDVMVKITDNKNIPTEYQVYLSLYHELKMGENNYYKQLPPDFFDLIVIDECHRSSAAESSENDPVGNWHDILEYFGSAIQIGLTATPKETDDVSNIHYFCTETDDKPIYNYTLKQGIEDGFLAPYKVTTVEYSVDRDGYVPSDGECDTEGNPVQRRLYTMEEFDKKPGGIIINSRREAVADRIIECMHDNGDMYAKTIVFCQTREHAGAMRRLLETKLSDFCKEDSRYITRIVSDDAEGNALLEDFTSPNSKYPVIATTSKLLSTGVDTKTVKLIVLDRVISSMTEFKQIIGRGSRIEEGYEIDGKTYDKSSFTILDFRRNYLKFRDPDFDGDPVKIYDENVDHDPHKPYKSNTKSSGTYIPAVEGSNVEITSEVTRQLDENLELVQENIESSIKNNIHEQYKTIDEFKSAWMAADNKTAFADDLLIEKSYTKKVASSFGFNIDKYDILLFVGYDIKPMSKEERLKKPEVLEYLDAITSEKLQQVLDILFECYRHDDFCKLKDIKVFDLRVFEIAGWSRLSAINAFGGKDKFLATMDEIEKRLYE